MTSSALQVTVLIYDEFTALDAVGPYDLLSCVPGATVEFVAAVAGPIRTDTHMLALQASRSYAEVSSTDVLVVPGGFGTYEQVRDDALLEWIRAVDATTTWTTSVCTGSLILGAAGLLEGLAATTHWAAADALQFFGATYRPERYVQEGKIITAAGVSAGIDMSLYLIAQLAGEDVARAAQLATEYDPRPPYDSGAPANVPEHIRELALTMHVPD
jgi:transcriptional regulator GlxA family with amidase domain